MVTIKMKNGIKIKIGDSQMDCLSRKHDGSLELNFNPSRIHVMSNKKGEEQEILYSFSEIKIESLFGQEVIRGYNYDNKKEVIVPMHQVKEFGLTGSKAGFFDKQEATCILK